MDRGGCRLGSHRRERPPCCGDDGYLTTDEFSSEDWQSARLVLRPSVLNRHVVAIVVPGFAQPSTVSGGVGLGLWCEALCRIAAEKSDHRHLRLLRARGKRPRHRAANNPFYKIASSHCLSQAQDRTSKLAFNLGHQNRKLRPAIWG